MKLLLEDGSEDELVREKIIDVFTKTGDPTAAEALIGVLEDGNASIVTKASMALKEMGKAAVEPLAGALESGSLEMRHEVVVLLGEIGNSEAIGTLTNVLKNRSEGSELRGDAAEALGRIGEYAATPVLIEAVSEDEEYGLRCRSVIALGNLGDPKAGAVLADVVQNKDNPLRIRGLAAEALGKTGDQKVAMPLMATLKDEREEGWVKGNAVWALGELGCREATPIIIKYVRDCWKAGDTDGIGRGAEALNKIGAFCLD